MRLSPKTLLIAAAITAPSSAFAGPADCENIAAAYEKLGALPAVRQQVSSSDGSKMESIMLGDALFLNADGEWTKMQLQPGQRAAMFKQLFDKLSIDTCTPAGGDTLDGRATTMFDYVVPPLGGGKADTQRVWIGADDGLPRQMLSQDGTRVVLSFEGIEAPVP
jgi:outer membrane lipoprotein-sorting protein